MPRNSRPSNKRQKQNKPIEFRRGIERLEERTVLSSYSVINLNDHGNGSLRQAIKDANKHPGGDTISFSVAGVITLSSALPKITDNVNIDGTSAPSFTGAPVVEIDNHGHNGLEFNKKSTGSDISSLSIVNAKNSGITVNGAHGVLITGNYIGLELNGQTVAANKGHGIEFDKVVASNIGGSTAQDRNVISGNKKNGILLSGSTENLIYGNYIGTSASGNLRRANGESGVAITNSSTENTVGGSTGNVISGNAGYGVLVNSKSNDNTISSNLIGLNAAGNSALGNTLDGIKLDGVKNNVVGQADPVTGVSYYNANGVTLNGQAVSGWQGLRAGDSTGQYIITGTSEADGLLYIGNIAGTSGTTYAVDYPNAYNSSVYGPDNLGGGLLRLVGSYKNSDYATAPVEVNGFLFEGTTSDLTDPSNYMTIDYAGAKFNYVHSTSGGLVVGNYDSPDDYGSIDAAIGPGHAYIYDVATQSFLTDITFPGSRSNSAYGIWHNGGTSYTIVGGYSLDEVNNFDDQNRPIGQGYMVDYDSATGQFSHWASFSFPGGKNFVTHFEGISSVENGVYTLNAVSAQLGTSAPMQGSFVTVKRNAEGSFGESNWVTLNYPGYDPTSYVTTSNSVTGNQVVGLVVGVDSQGQPQSFSYQATVNVAFELSNTISGNGGSGINLSHASNNQISMNYIGTDATGTIDLGNAQNGILVTAGSTDNMIGGQTSGGNNPTNGEFVVPPQGNLISGNQNDGILINAKSTHNQISGNFVGTNYLGDSAIGNSHDGVAIVNADNNTLLGCTFETDPFVFYNVISGNGGNGLVVDSSNNTTIQANFFGLAADNATALGNALNGVVVKGTSAHTTMGGPIPLGNVDSCNGLNGVLLEDKASYFVSYNTFCGTAAFVNSSLYGNGADGFLITSTGGHNLLRTNVIAANAGNGIELAGEAQDVDIVGNIVGLNWDGLVAEGNGANGILVGGNAHDISIGGLQPTFNVIPQNTISSNTRYGVDIEGTAHGIIVNHSYIGAGIDGVQGLGNTLDGIKIGSGTYANVIGSTDPSLTTVVSDNAGNGITLSGTHDNTIQHVLIGVDRTGGVALGNGASGVNIINSNNNTIGGAPDKDGNSRANTIAFNGTKGVFVQSGNGNGIRQNSIFSNTSLGIDLLAGANNNQAAPVLISAQRSPQNLEVSGTLSSTPKSTFTIEFFANTSNSASGRIFLGSQTVKTDAAGIAAFTFLVDLPPVGVNFITSTATDSANNTSEFSTPISAS